MDINFTVNQNTGVKSYLQNPEYASYYMDILNEFKDDFPGVDTVNVDIKEKLRDANDISPCEKGRLINRNRYDIVISFFNFRNNRGKPLDPTSHHIFETIRHRMRDEVKHYAELSNQKNPVLRARLKQLGVDMSSNKSPLANELHGSLGTNGYKLDLDQRIWSLSTDDLYQLGRIIIVNGSGGKPFSHSEIVSKMSALLEIQY